MKKISSFAKKVYQLTAKIPKGRVSTYQQIAMALKTKAYQAVGQALKNNPHAFTLNRTSSGAGPQVPCHRVVKSNGTIGGFNGSIKAPAIKRKISLLKKEGIEFKGSKIVDFKKVVFSFKK